MVLDWKGVLAAGAVLGVVVLVLREDAKKAAVAVGNAVNPVSQDNIFYQGTNAIGGAVTGDQDFSLGSWLYDYLHSDEEF